MRAHEAGLIDLWYDWNMADSSRCLNPVTKNADSSKIRLGFGGLSGAFIILALGASLSIFVFLLEMIHKLYSNNRRLDL